MRLVSATDLAIAIAIKNDTLRVVERASRLGGNFAAIEDDRGVIEVHDSSSDAEIRIETIRAAL